jgi:oligoendopeptidase F
MLELRGKITRGAALPDYRAYRWKQMLRFDYTPEDCSQFHQAIEQVAVPAAISLYERRRKRLGLAQLRPWDVYVDPESRPQIKPFQSAQELEEGVSSIFRQVDPELQAYFEIMRREGLLDLDNRKGKAPGGYCTDFVVSGKPFIFMNAVGIREDVQTLLHEGGHAFHVFESAALPFLQQKQVGLEFAEVASMGMELLAAPYLSKEQGGFYSKQETARARIEHLEEAIRFWAYMAVVDAFQHWVYENLELAKDPLNCDAKWGELWDRFMLGVDWSGLEDEKNTGWQRKLHIFQDPFYYIEYGLAQMGAFQVWRNALQDQKGAVVNYRKALALGGTASLPQLFQTAGVRFAFDAETLREVVELGMKTIEALENEI